MGLNASQPPPVSANPPRSAYIHVPFCRHRCGYCNFTLVAGRDDLIDSYLSALTQELSWLGEAREVETLFFGGGTPTHLRGEQLQKLLDMVANWHPLAAGCEFSVEANPADVDAETIDILVDHGVTRISLGAQSFHLEKLKLLERDHVAEDISRAVKLARARNLDVSLDLIFGAPGETLSAWQTDLQMAIQLSPDHVSTYGLTFEEGTAFWNRLQRGELSRVAETVDRELYETAIDTLLAAGFEHYEVSNFALPGKRCRHNEVYWTGGEYFAAGPGAARFVDGAREINLRSVTAWIARIQVGKSPVAERECLPPQEKARELLVFGLRRLAGVKHQWFTETTGYTIEELVGEPLARFTADGYLVDAAGRLCLTREGLMISDALWPHFLKTTNAPQIIQPPLDR